MSAVNKELSDILRDVPGENVIFAEPLARHSTMGVGGTARVWYRPVSTEELSKVYRILSGAGERVIVVGGGSNTLFPDGVLNAVVVDLSGGNFNGLRFEKCRVTADAGMKLGTLVGICCARGLSGMQGLIGIPGTLGGAISVNAGYRSTISDKLVKVKLLGSDGNVRYESRDNIEFGYRRSSLSEKDIVLEAVFDLTKETPGKLKEEVKALFLEKARSQPLGEKTLGCVFKNPAEAILTGGQMIDSSGFKGLRVGGAVVSEKHANFIVNSGGATSGDVREVMRMVRDGVKKKFGIDLEPEIRMIDP